MGDESKSSNPSLAEIEAFVRAAAPLAWPSATGEAKSPDLRGFWESAVRIGRFAFVDLFGGARTDVGFEVAFHDDQLVWGAAYRGGLSDTTLDIDHIYGFLGRALNARPAEAIPVRGPREYREPGSPWTYRHELTGDFGGFTSLERMYDGSGLLIYERLTVGGVAGDAPYLQWVDVPPLP